LGIEIGEGIEADPFLMSGKLLGKGLRQGDRLIKKTGN
jgi:hypothetical protein